MWKQKWDLGSGPKTKQQSSRQQVEAPSRRKSARPSVEGERQGRYLRNTPREPCMLGWSNQAGRQQTEASWRRPGCVWTHTRKHKLMISECFSQHLHSNGSVIDILGDLIAADRLFQLNVVNLCLSIATKRRRETGRAMKEKQLQRPKLCHKRSCIWVGLAMAFRKTREMTHRCENLCAHRCLESPALLTARPPSLSVRQDQTTRIYGQQK